MNQLGKASLIVLGFCEVVDLCLVRALRDFISVRRNAPGFFFCHETGAPLTKHQFWAVSSRALSNMGLQGARFCTHSFRIGAASTAAAMGFPSAIIQ